MTPLHGHTKSSSPVFSSCVQISVAGIKIMTIWPRLFLTMLHQIEDFLMSLYLERDLLLKEGLHYRQVVITTSKNKSGVPCLVLIHSGLIWLSRKTFLTSQQHLEVDEGSSSKISLHQLLSALGGCHHQRGSPLLVCDV